jgi:AAA15 family ATPase/GTPase
LVKEKEIPRDKIPAAILNDIIKNINTKDGGEVDLNDIKAVASEIYFLHNKYNNDQVLIGLEPINYKHQSQGSKRLFALMGPIFDTLQNGNILVIDEFDARFHPLISHFIVSLFNSNKYNKHNAQLIFATHDTTLLTKELFRRDQIWFTEKDKYGSSDLYSLCEYKPRQGEALQKNYLQGKYGAIPFFGDFNYVLGE